jgi:hypothetical protein
MSMMGWTPPRCSLIGSKWCCPGVSHRDSGKGAKKNQHKDDSHSLLGRRVLWSVLRLAGAVTIELFADECGAET